MHGERRYSQTRRDDLFPLGAGRPWRHVWLILLLAALCGCESDGGHSTTDAAATDFGVSNPSKSALVMRDETLPNYTIVGVWIDNLDTPADNRDSMGSSPMYSVERGMLVSGTVRIPKGGQRVYTIDPGHYRLHVNWGTSSAGSFVSREFEVAAGRAVIFAAHGGGTGRRKVSKNTYMRTSKEPELTQR